MNYEKCMKNATCKTCSDRLVCEQEKYHEHIIINYKLDNWNDTIKKCRSNYHYANTSKQKEMNTIGLFLTKMKPIKKYPIKITCIWHISNVLRDLDNCSIKSVLDQMQEMGKLENDNVKHIQEISYKYLKDKENYLEMYIDEI